MHKTTNYAKFYAYFTGQKDENGKTVDAFSYSTFRELVMYENTSLRENAVPMFSFNYKAAHKKYYAETYKNLPYVADSNYSSYYSVWSYLDNYYEKLYLSNGGKVSDKDPMYCFMLDVYYTIRQAVKKTGSLQPTYLKLYKEFLDGDTTRWGEVRGTTINGASVYFEKFERYKMQLQMAKAKVVSSYIKNWIIPVYSLTDLIGDAANAYASAIALEAELLTLDGDGASEKADDIMDRFDSIVEGVTNIQTVQSVLKKVFVNNPKYSDYIDYIYTKDNLFFAYFYSEDSALSRLTGSLTGGNYSESWELITGTYDRIGQILAELSELSYLEENQQTNKGTIRYEGLKDNTLYEVYYRL